jgi:hypothetical protein
MQGYGTTDDVGDDETPAAVGTVDVSIASEPVSLAIFL